MVGGGKTKSTQQQNTTQTMELPAWMTAAGQQLWGDASKAATDNPITAYGAPMTAGMSGNQRAAGALARASVGAGRADLDTARNMTAAAAGPYQTAQSRDVRTATMTPAQQGFAPTVGADQVGSADFDSAAAQRYMNPYNDQVTGRTLDEMQRRNKMEVDSLGDAAQASKAFGGTRHAVLEGETRKGQQANMLDYMAKANADAYASAQGQFNADRGSKMTADLANQGSKLQADTTTASFLDQLLGRNMAAKNEAGQFNAASKNQMGQANADRAADTSRFNAGLNQSFLDRLLSAGDQFGKIAEADTNLSTRDMDNLLRTGGVEQDTNNAQLMAAYQEFLRMQDAPMERYRDLGAILAGTPRNVTTTGSMSGTSTTQQQGSWLNTMLGLGQMGASVFSDRRLKSGIARVAELAGGMGLYLFRYRWEPEDAPRHVSVMADEVPAAALGPRILGFATVDYSKLGAI